MKQTFYDRSGMPVAYLPADGDRVIYSINGSAHGYLIGPNIFSPTGRHIGSIHNGEVFDRLGRKVGYTY